MLRNNIIYTAFSEWRFDIAKAKGCFIWTSDDKKLIDFTSGWNVANLGWNHPEINQAMIDEMSKNSYSSMWMGGEIQNKYAQMLTDVLPKRLNAVGRATGGTEAIEEALKTARAFTERKKIIGFHNTYHGQSFGAMSIPHSSDELPDLAPLIPDFIQIEFPAFMPSRKDQEEILENFADRLEKLLKVQDVAAIVSEAGIVTGGGDLPIAPDGYLKSLRKITKKYGTLLILDEVGTGFSRTGKLFGMELEGVEPDIVCFAKAQSNGAAPIGSMVTTQEIADKTFTKSSIGSTYGWLPLPCAAAVKTLEIHQRDKVWEKADDDGKYILKILANEFKNDPKVIAIRGSGMELAIELLSSDLAGQVRQKAIDNGLHLAPGGSSTLQIMPILTIDRPTLDEGLDKLIQIIKTA